MLAIECATGGLVLATQILCFPKKGSLANFIANSNKTDHQPVAKRSTIPTESAL
jgi:hypothetical protein